MLVATQFLSAAPDSVDLAEGYYLQILEKTNQQLSLWTNPYSICVAVLGVLFTALALVVAFYGLIGYRRYLKEITEEREEGRRMLELQRKISERAFKDATSRQIALYDERLDQLIKNYEGRLSSMTNDKTKEIASILDELSAERVRLVSSLVPSQNYLRQTKLSFSPGCLIKGETLEVVYWYGYDGNRYSFPDQDVLESWFPSLVDQKIRNITDAELAEITLAGNMVYKAGTRLIKISSDPKIYAVGQNGLIHWLKDENLIPVMYGQDWRKKLVTVKDVYFLDYSVGRTVKKKEDFIPEFEKSLDKLP